MAIKIYQHDEIVLRFIPAAASLAEDAIFEVDGLGSGAGRTSARFDLGTAARSDRYAWRAFVQFATAPIVGEIVRVYLKTEATDGYPDNDDTNDAAVSAEDKLKNLHFIGAIVVDQAQQDIQMAASGEVFLPARYVGVVFWNATQDALTTDVDENGFFLTPIPMESQ